MKLTEEKQKQLIADLVQQEVNKKMRKLGLYNPLLTLRDVAKKNNTTVQTVFNHKTQNSQLINKKVKTYNLDVY